MEGRGPNREPATGNEAVHKRRRSKPLEGAEQRGRTLGSAPAGRQPHEGNGGAVMHHRLSAGKVLRRVPALRGRGLEQGTSVACVRSSGSGSPGGGGRGPQKRSEPWLARVAKHPEPSRGASRRGGEKPRGRNMRQAWQRAAEGVTRLRPRGDWRRASVGGSWSFPGVDARRSCRRQGTRERIPGEASQERSGLGGPHGALKERPGP